MERHFDQELQDLKDSLLTMGGRAEAVIQKSVESLKRRDFHSLWVLAHTMKGLGASYGFDGISEIGAEMEQAAMARPSASGD